LQQLLNDVLDVFANIPRFCQGSSVSNRKGDIQQPGQRFGKKCFACASGTHHENIAFPQLDTTGRMFIVQTFVMIVNSNSQYFFWLALVR